jgi:hypothetical protein
MDRKWKGGGYEVQKAMASLALTRQGLATTDATPVTQVTAPAALAHSQFRQWNQAHKDLQNKLDPHLWEGSPTCKTPVCKTPVCLTSPSCLSVSLSLLSFFLSVLSFLPSFLSLSRYRARSLSVCVCLNVCLCFCFCVCVCLCLWLLQHMYIFFLLLCNRNATAHYSERQGRGGHRLLHWQGEGQQEKPRWNTNLNTINLHQALKLHQALERWSLKSLLSRLLGLPSLHASRLLRLQSLHMCECMWKQDPLRYVCSKCVHVSV